MNGEDREVHGEYPDLRGDELRAVRGESALECRHHTRAHWCQWGCKRNPWDESITRDGRPIREVVSSLLTSGAIDGVWFEDNYRISPKRKTRKSWKLLTLSGVAGAAIGGGVLVWKNRELILRLIRKTMRR